MKEDPLGYSYLVGIRSRSNEITNDNPSSYYIDMFQEIPRTKLKEMEEWVEVFKDPIHPLDPLTEKECTEITGIKPLKIPFKWMKLRARMNPGTTIHLFHTTFKMTPEYFEIFIKFPDIKKLKESRIF